MSVVQVPQYTFEYELMGPSLPDACNGLLLIDKHPLLRANASSARRDARSIIFREDSNTSYQIRIALT